MYVCRAAGKFHPNFTIASAIMTGQVAIEIADGTRLPPLDRVTPTQ